MPFDREGTLRKAEKLIRQGRLDLAIAEYRAVVEDQPTDWNTSNTLGDLYFRSGDVEKAIEQYCRIADHLADEGFLSKAAALYRKILKIKSDDERAMWQLGNVAARQGLLVDARLNFQTLADRRRARHDRRGEAEVRVRLGELDGADVDARIAGARARAELGDPRKAADQLKEFAASLQEKGKDADALRLLNEAAQIDPQSSVDVEAAGRLAAIAAESQTLPVADEPFEAGPNDAEAGDRWGRAERAAREAVAAEDWDAAAAALTEYVAHAPNHVPALIWLVEICIEGGLETTMHSAQARLADAYLDNGAGLEARIIAEDLVAREPWEQANLDRFRRALTLLGEADVDAIIAERLGGESPFTTTNARWPEPEPLIPSAQEPAEVELDDMLYDLGKPREASEAAPPVEDVLNGIREEAARDASPEMAEQHFKLAETFMEIGMKMEAIKALEVAARSPRHRFRASAMLAKACLDSGDARQAIEWYGQAAEAPAPSPQAHYVVMYEMASVLEAEGEGARALAVLLELQSEAGEYRDVADRLEQLKVQIGPR